MIDRVLDGFLCCLVGADQYALRGADVSLVARAEEIRPQDADDQRIGVLARANAEIPIYSLAALLGGRRDARTADRHVVVTGPAGRQYGVLVDRLVRAAGRGAEVLPLPGIVGGAAVRWFEGLVSLQETSCLVLAPEGLRPGGRARDGGAAGVHSRGQSPRAEIRSLVLTFSSAALPPLAVARYAIGASRVAAMVQSLPMVSLPGCGRHVAAIAAWRRSAVAVLDFSPAASVTATARRFLVARCGGGALIAIAVDSETSLRRASARDARSGAAATDSYVRGIFRVGNEDIALLDIDRLASGDAAIVAAAAPEVLAPALV